MPDLPDRAGGSLPDSADVVVVGGGYLGLTAALRSAQLGARVVLLEAEQLGYGASTRNGGLVHVGYKWGAAELVARHGPELGRRLVRESAEAVQTVDALVTAGGIACDWRRDGHAELAFAPSHASGLETEARTLDEFGVAARVLSRDETAAAVGSEAYFGALVVEASGRIHPGQFYAGLVRLAESAGVELHERTRARSIRRQADGRTVVETDRGAIIAGTVVVGTNGYTDGLVPALRRRIIPIGSYMIATEPLPEAQATAVSPRGLGCFDSRNFLFYWQLTADRRLVFGGRASFVPTSVDRTARILQRGMVELFPALRDIQIAYAWGGTLGFTFDRMPHVGRRDGLIFALGCCGSGVALMSHYGTRIAEWVAGGDPPAIAELPFPLVPAPYEGRPWFLPFVGEWYRLKDRLAARERRSARARGRTQAGAG